MCRGMLRFMFDVDTTTVLSDSNLALVEELRTVRETIKSLKSREVQIRKALLAELKDAELGLTASGAPVIEVQHQPRTRIDTNRLQALHRAVWEDCQVQSTVSVLRLPEVLD